MNTFITIKEARAWTSDETELGELIRKAIKQARQAQVVDVDPKKPKKEE